MHSSIIYNILGGLIIRAQWHLLYIYNFAADVYLSYGRGDASEHKTLVSQTISDDITVITFE